MNKLGYIFVWAWILVLFSCSGRQPEQKNTQLRIISMVPSLTEIMFELDLGKYLVGISKFSNFPDSVQYIEKVGGLYDANVEKIIRLNPDYLIMDKSRYLAGQLDKISNSQILSLKTETIEDIFKNIDTLGIIFNRVDQAKHLIQQIDDSLLFYQKEIIKKEKKVLCVINRSPGKVSQVYAAGRETFINELLEHCGLTNSLELEGYPQLNTEFLYKLDVNYIFEIRAEITDNEIDFVKENWRKFYGNRQIIPAVLVFNKDYMTIPGPRVWWGIRDMVNAINE